MNVFDMTKDFKRIYIQKGQTAGRLQGKKAFIFEAIKPREKKGTDYAKQVLDEDRQVQSCSSQRKTSDEASMIDDLEWTTVGTGVNPMEIDNSKIINIYKEYYENMEKPNNNLIINSYKKKVCFSSCSSHISFTILFSMKYIFYRSSHL